MQARGLAALAVAVGMTGAIGGSDMAQGQERTRVSSQVRLTIGKRVVVRRAEVSAGTFNWFPNIHRMGNGDLIADCQIAPDAGTNANVQHFFMRMLSTDQGETWRELGPVATGGRCKASLSDGAFLRLFFYVARDGDGWATRVVRSQDSGATATTEERATVYVPGMREEAEGGGVAAMLFDRSMVEMANGDLLATMYGHLQGDQKYRCILVRSTDRGRTWRFVSTIAYDPTVGSESFCEPAMIRTGPASLLAVMRTGSASPMYQSRSTNAGETWSQPQVAADRGVCPDVAMTDDGVLVCSYGRPNVYVMCSPDGFGRKWMANTLIYEGSSTCYTGMAKIGPNQILLVHDALNHKEPGDSRPYNYIFAVPLRVERMP